MISIQLIIIIKLMKFILIALAFVGLSQATFYPKKQKYIVGYPVFGGNSGSNSQSNSNSQAQANGGFGGSSSSASSGSSSSSSGNGGSTRS